MSKPRAPRWGADQGADVRLLIAHESQAERERLADAVAHAGAEPLEILTTSDGPDTLDLLLQDDPPSVALVDWDLPGIEGPEMCRLVRDFHHGHDTWLVVLAASQHADTVDAWRAGADDCVDTPAAAETLRACVEKGLREMRPPQTRAVAGLRAVAEADSRPDLGARGRLTLDAVRTPDDDYYAADAVQLCAVADPDGRLAEMAGVRPAETGEPRGAALLQALIGEL